MTPTDYTTNASLEVEGIDDALKQIDAGDGSMVQPRTEILDMGAFASFKDSESNPHGLVGDGVEPIRYASSCLVAAPSLVGQEVQRA